MREERGENDALYRQCTDFSMENSIDSRRREADGRTIRQRHESMTLSECTVAYHRSLDRTRRGTDVRLNQRETHVVSTLHLDVFRVGNGSREDSAGNTSVYSTQYKPAPLMSERAPACLLAACLLDRGFCSAARQKVRKGTVLPKNPATPHCTHHTHTHPEHPNIPVHHGVAGYPTTPTYKPHSQFPSSTPAIHHLRPHRRPQYHTASYFSRARPCTEAPAASNRLESLCHHSFRSRSHNPTSVLPRLLAPLPKCMSLVERWSRSRPSTLLHPWDPHCSRQGL